MRVTIICDHEGTIRAVANCQMYRDRGVVGEVEIKARSLPVNALGDDSPAGVEEFQSHIVELPDRLVGSGLEEIRKLAYLDLSGDRPTLCLNKKIKKS
jgi:hypothetical protein